MGELSSSFNSVSATCCWKVNHLEIVAEQRCQKQNVCDFCSNMQTKATPKKDNVTGRLFLKKTYFEVISSYFIGKHINQILQFRPMWSKFSNFYLMRIHLLNVRKLRKSQNILTVYSTTQKKPKGFDKKGGRDTSCWIFLFSVSIMLLSLSK